MKIVPSSDQKVGLILFLTIYLVFIGMLFWDIWIHFSIGNCLGDLAVIIFMTVVFGSIIVFLGRTLYLDKHGCTITFWGYKKVIKWDEFQSKMYKPEVSTGMKYDRYLCHGVFFAVKPLPDKVQKVQYVKDYWMFHTFSSFYVLYPYQAPAVDPFVDGDEFLGLMKEWGVEIEGLEQSK